MKDIVKVRLVDRFRSMFDIDAAYHAMEVQGYKPQTIMLSPEAFDAFKQMGGNDHRGMAAILDDTLLGCQAMLKYDSKIEDLTDSKDEAH